MRVKDCMCKNVIKATTDTTLYEIAQLMQKNDIGCIPICNTENNLIGFVTDRDIITRCVAKNKNCNQTIVKDIMTNNIIKTTPDTEITAAAEIMSNNQIKRLPVIENNKIVGILTIGDLANNISNDEVGFAMEGICKNK